MTLQEYLATPETVLPRELIDGTLRVADAPFVNHQRAVFTLARALQEHADEHDTGEIFIAPIDVIMDRRRDLVLQPDLLFISRDRSDIVRERIYGAPDLVVEVLSPNPRIGTLQERVGWFAQYGVREIWLYRQNVRRVDVLTCEGGGVVSTDTFDRDQPLRSKVLPFFGRTMGSVLGVW